MSAYETIRYELRDSVLTLTLDRPQKLNAVTSEMYVELIDALDRADADDDVRAVIMTGSGRAFCAGADLAGGGSTFDHRKRGLRAGDVPRDRGGLVSLRIFSCLKPVIAAINGPAVGLGVTMTLPTDIRMASTSATFGFVFTRRGIVPEAGSSWFLPRIVGPSKAAEWLYSGRIFGADEAHAAGLVRSVHPPEELLGAATQLAHELTDETAPVSVALARQLLWHGLSFNLPYESHVADSRAMHVTGLGPDAREGVDSFLQKRRPAFPGRVSADLPDIFDGERPAWADTFST